MDAVMTRANDLPAARTDLAGALADLDVKGMALFEGAFSPQEIDEARATVMTLAASELVEGGAVLNSGTQRVFGLIQKAPVFRRIAVNPIALALAHHILGPRMMLYSMQAHIVPPGGAMYAHFDQSDHKPMPPFPVVAAVVLMLDDFTAENGATVVYTGGLAKSLEDPAPSLDEMVPVTGVKGTISAYGGLLWHSTGINRTETPRVGILLHYCMPWIRQHENYQRTISAAVARDMTPQMRDLLGIHEHLFGRRWHAVAPEFADRSMSHGE